MQNSAPDTQDILKTAKIIAMIGASPNMYRTSNYAFKYLMDEGYKVIPVNPMVEEVNGEKCYANINDIPESVPVHIVNVFRNKEYTLDEVKEVVAWKNKTGQKPVIWTQLDVSTPEAEALAFKEGLPYIRNKCIMVELDKLVK